MHRRRSFVCTLAFSVVLMFFARAASPQSVPPSVPASSQPTVRWSAGAGFETLSFRDIARTSRPVTASPIAWRGSGPVLRARAGWDNGRRLHQIDFGGSFSAGFEYTSPLRADAASADDRARYFEARYEYRRYLFRDLLMRGLDLGLGAEALGARVSFARRLGPSAIATESRLNTGVGGSLAVRVRRWNTIGAHVSWTNGLVIGKRHEQRTGSAAADGGGGGWQTTFAGQMDVRLSRRSTLFANYTQSGEGFLASHASYVLSRRGLSMGVTYGR